MLLSFVNVKMTVFAVPVASVTSMYFTMVLKRFASTLIVYFPGGIVCRYLPSLVVVREMFRSTMSNCAPGIG